MQFVNLTTPLKVPIRSYPRHLVKEGHNELYWLASVRSTIEIARLEKHAGKIMGTSQNGSVYTILPAKSKSTEKGFVIQSEVIGIEDLWLKLQNNNQGPLQWKSFRGTETSYNLPDENDLLSVPESFGVVDRIKEEMFDDNGNIVATGLSPPQTGAIYSILSSWAVSKDLITVVLPTGTGKSETILGTIVARKVTRSLIIVPSNGLREQFYKNCINWGILRKINIVDDNVENPIVLKLASSPKNEELFTGMLLTSNIVIATTDILNALPEKYLVHIKERFDVVFIDEAHHSAAPTWEYLKNNFINIPTVQFTATPFREDKRPITGKIVFQYSLEQAQKNNYFTKIEFIPVVDYDPDNWDQTIANKAIEILRKDIEDGHNHFLMARVDNISKAKAIYDKFYKDLTEFNPLLITSKSASVNEKIADLRSGKSKVVVCVNMLGEGVDIPELKIAALHDIRKSLTITLQFVGRFTRSNKSKSSAKIIANIADVDIEKRLKQLYKEDADWGKLIAFASAKEIQKKIKFQELLANFVNSRIPLYNIKPKMSAVAYRTKSDVWTPNRVEEYLNEKELLYLYDLNEQDKIAIAIYQQENNIDWLDSNVFTESTWELMLLYFDSRRQMLYINSSIKNVEDNLVNSIAEIDYRFENEEPFKVYSGSGYVVLFTFGMDKLTDNPIKYAMYAGDDVIVGISNMEKNTSRKNNTYGYGFNEGIETTLGASKKGKIWSRLIGNIQEWKEWCDEIGTKLLDPEIDVNEIFRGFLQPRRFSLPEFYSLSAPVSIDWPTSFYQDNESVQQLILDGHRYLSVNEITLFISKTADGYKVHLNTEDNSQYLNLHYTADSYNWTCEGFKTIEYIKKSKVYDFIQFLKDDTFKIRLQDGTFIENNYHFKPFQQDVIFPLDTDLLFQKDWTGTQTNVESMGLKEPKKETSIQYRMYYERQLDPLYQIIVNDDDAGEAADLICIGVEKEQLLIEAIHCKYMLSKDKPGSRVSDFYELTCQAQKTIKNFSNVMRLYDHVKSRNSRSNKAGLSRFVKGDLRTLEILLKTYSFKRPKFKVTMVQPALAKDLASKEVLELLGSTYTLLQETINADFQVICS